jgi:hypothetical protein
MAWMMMLAPLPNPVPGAGNFNVMLPGKYWRAAKAESGRSIKPALIVTFAYNPAALWTPSE